MRIEQSQKWITRETGQWWEFGGETVLIRGTDDVNGIRVAALVRSAMPYDGQEHLVVVCADAHGVPLAVGKVATGSVDNCPLYARDVYAFALAVPRTRFVGIAHNHPSGDVSPSGADKTASGLVARIGKMLALDLLWSMVVTHESSEWALVPLKHTPDETGEREPSAPKDPEPEQDPDEDAPEDEQEPEGEPEGDGDEPEPGDEQTGQTEPEPEPDPDGDESDEDGDEDGGTGDPDEDGDGETPEDPGDDEDGGDEDGNGEGDAPPDSMAPGNGSKPEASIDDLKAAIKAAFKL